MSVPVITCKNVRQDIIKEGGAKHTRDRRPIMIIYSEQYGTLVEARRRESQVKKWSRVKKENLATGKHPTKN